MTTTTKHVVSQDVDQSKLIAAFLSVTDAQSGEQVRATLIDPGERYYRINWYCINQKKIVRSEVRRLHSVGEGRIPIFTPVA